MSEYQYYEFAAVDSPLTPQQQAELRSRSSRATMREVQDLAEAHRQGDNEAAFRKGLARLMRAHGKRATWVARLTKAGLLGGSTK